MIVRGVVLSGITAVAFGLLYQVSGWSVAIAGLIGMISWGIAAPLDHLANARLLGTFVGAFCVGAAAEVAAKVKQEPSLVFLVPAIIVFVPGELAYKSMVAFLRNHFVAGLEAGLTAFLEAGAIAVGLALATALVRPLLRRHGSPPRHS
ncbi:MAG: threonine/serine exporter family protein [Firmicutes bacterium]|nr:threonine/serine exporter family protein [Bacillota bacterium]